MIKHTPQQDAFNSTALASSEYAGRSIALVARAGSGKTYSLQNWAKASRKGGIATSFSKITVGELTDKMPPRFESNTMHSLGLRTIKRSGKFTSINKSKVFDLTKDICDQQSAGENKVPFEYQASIRQLVGLAKSFGIQPDPNGDEGLTPNDQSAWDDLADMYDIDVNPEIFGLAKEVLIKSNVLAIKEGIIDFDDMLYIPTIWRTHKFPKVPVIICDEVQDFSILQQVMIRRCLLPGGRVIAAGDDRQAIYAFRGALTDSYSSLIQTFDMKRMPLTVSFRCPKAVVREAQQYVPDIEFAPNAIEGEVLWPQQLDLNEIPNTVICRNNAPLIKLALALLVEGRTVEVAGKDIGAGLVKLTKRITKKANMPAEEFMDRLDRWRERETERYPKRRASIADKTAALRALSVHNKDLASIRNHLAKLYPDPDSRSYRPAEVYMSTIHRAKGCEWPNVMLLDPQLMPSKFAKQDFELVQEANLAYVAVTRAQETLWQIASEDINGVEDGGY